MRSLNVPVLPKCSKLQSTIARLKKKDKPCYVELHRLCRSFWYATQSQFNSDVIIYPITNWLCDNAVLRSTKRRL